MTVPYYMMGNMMMMMYYMTVITLPFADKLQRLYWKLAAVALQISRLLCICTACQAVLLSVQWLCATLYTCAMATHGLCDGSVVCVGTDASREKASSYDLRKVTVGTSINISDIRTSKAVSDSVVGPLLTLGDLAVRAISAYMRPMSTTFAAAVTYMHPMVTQ